MFVDRDNPVPPQGLSIGWLRHSTAQAQPSLVVKVLALGADAFAHVIYIS